MHEPYIPPISHSDRHPRGRRRLVAGMALALGASVVSIPVQEWAVRLALPEFNPAQQIRFELTPDGAPLAVAGTRYRQIKNTGDYNVSVQINRHGFRDDKDIADAEPGDVVVVGDSFAFGWGVEAHDRFSDQLARLSSRRVFNIAAPGNFNNYDALVRHAQALGARFNCLVIAVTMENDLARYYQPADTSRGPVSSGDTLLNQLKEWAAANSELYFLVTSAVHNAPWLKQAAVRLGLVVDILAAVPTATTNEFVIKDSIERLQAMAKGFNVTVLVIPSRSLWTGSDADRGKADAVHRAFVDGLRARGLTVVDPRTSFEEGGSPLSYHFDNDGHWKPRGHLRAAEALATAIQLRE